MIISFVLPDSSSLDSAIESHSAMLLILVPKGYLKIGTLELSTTKASLIWVP